MGMGTLKQRTRDLLQNLERTNSLLKHFLLRLINNDVLILDKQHRVNLLPLMTLLPAMMGVLAHLLLRAYLFGEDVNPMTLWLEKTYFMTASMAFVGIVYTIIWENMSLDGTDFNNLLPHPISSSWLLFGKWTGNLAFIVLFTAVLHLFSTPIFVLYLTRQSNIPPLQLGLIHLMSHILSGIFVFFSIAIIQITLKSNLPLRWYSPVSKVVRVILFVIFITSWLWFPTVYPLLPFLKETHSPFIYRFPPLWFVGWGEYQIGNHDPVFQSHIYILIMAVVIPAALFLLCLFRQHRNHLKIMPKTISDPQSPKLASRFDKLMHRFVIKRPLERCMYHFTLKTLNRSHDQKRLIFRYWLGAMVFIFAAATVLYVQRGTAIFKSGNIYLVGAPLVIILFTVLGARAVIHKPITINHRDTAPLRIPSYQDMRPFLRGYKKAIFLYIILPLSVIIFLSLLVLCGLKTALFHTLFCLTNTLLLINIYFINYSKVPFLDPPNRKGLGRFIIWAFKMTGFIFLVYSLTRVGLFLLNHPGYYFLYYILVCILFFLMKWIHHYFHSELVFTYNKALGRVMVSLDIGPERREPYQIQ